MTNREIDALVAERVFGWSMSKADGFWRKHPDDRWPTNPADLPEYTVDPADDYQVLRHVRETWDEEQKSAFLIALEAALQHRVPRHWHWEAAAPVFYQPGDYARAALRALGVEVPES